jgi:hypothetical protein
MAGILWLASYPKSGNTWMRIFLANLILNEPEPVPFERINSICPGEAHEDWFKPFTDRPVSELSRVEIAKLRWRAQMRAAKLMKHILPLKTHNYLGEDCGYPLIAMEGTRAAIYILRDPRDIALSATDHFGVSVGETIEIMNKEGAIGHATAGQTVGANGLRGPEQLVDPRQVLDPAVPRQAPRGPLRGPPGRSLRRVWENRQETGDHDRRGAHPPGGRARLFQDPATNGRGDGIHRAVGF